METILEVVQQKDYDRNVFITYLNNEVKGINFHQGINEIQYDFSAPCEALTSIYNRLPNGGMIDRINKAIDLYCDSFIHQKNNTYIPLHQRKLIQKALDFYISCSEKLNKDPNDEESFELFDIMQLSAMMNYDLVSSLTDEQCENFDSKHNVHYPEYKIY